MVANFLRRTLLTVAVLFGLTACGDEVELLSQISEPEANEVLAALLDAGITTRKVAGKEGMVSVHVDGDKVGEAIRILRANGLPRERFAGMGEVFKKEGLISSPLEERARYIYALSQGLAETLSQIDGVITARVHVVLPEREAGTGPLAPSSAAVFIKYQEAYDLERVVPQIKRLVTNSISNLSSDKVSVVLVPSLQREAAPVTAAPEDRGWMWWLVGGLGVLALAGLSAAGALFWLWRIKPRRAQVGTNAE